MAWSQSPSGDGRTNWAGALGGVPGAVPAWSMARAGKYGLLADVCTDGLRIYLLSAGIHVHSLRLDDGTTVWEREFEDNRGAVGLCVYGGWVAAGWRILDKEAGAPIGDFRDAAGRQDIGKYSHINALQGGFVREVQGNDVDDLFVDVDAGAGRILGSRLRGIVLSASDGRLFGWRDGMLRCFDVSKGQEVWAVAVPLAKNGEPMTAAGFSVLSGRIYLQLNRTTVWCIDAANGDILWKSGPDEIEANEQPQQCSPPNIIMACDDRVYLVSQVSEDGVFMSFDAQSGHVAWERAVNGFQGGCILGDLIFGVRDMSVLVAWDRYSGEEVWQAKKPMGAAYATVADGNYVLYASTAGELRCFRWEEPYVSPAKP